MGHVKERRVRMSASVLTEANFDGMLLATLLADEEKRDGVDIRVVSGLSSGLSVARTMLAVKRRPVAVVIDADSPEQEVASERQRSAEEVLADAASGVPFRVIVAVPELAILFFERPQLLKRVYGKSVTAWVTELGQVSPRRALQKLDPDLSYEYLRFKILRAMDEADIKALRATALIQELPRFLKEAVEYSKRSAVSRV
jgi:hypothetical protein